MLRDHRQVQFQDPLAEVCSLYNPPWIFANFANLRRDRRSVMHEPESFEELTNGACFAFTKVRKKAAKQKERTRHGQNAGSGL
jgi:hypothetical protein